MDFIAKEEPNNLLPDVKKKYIHISNTKTALQSVHKYQNKSPSAFNYFKVARGNPVPSNITKLKSKSKENPFSNEKNNYFSYQKMMKEYILKLMYSEKGQKLKRDIPALMQIIGQQSKLSQIRNRIHIFKKNTHYFNFQLIQSRLLFHLISAQVQFTFNNVSKTVQQFQFSEYHSRKEGLDIITVCFLWELVNLHIHQLQFEKATDHMQNLIQMSIVLGIHNKLNRFIFQKMSLIYYYRGNSILSLYYLDKSEKGLQYFEKQIYNREYNKKQQIVRLQSKLFTTESSELPLKRKNNPRFQEDINRNSFQEHHETATSVYVERVNSMMKSHDSSKNGKFIKHIIRKNKNIGNVKSYNQTNYPRSKMTQCTIDNCTRVLKTHLSRNRQNIKINPEQRWKKFSLFIKQIFAIVNDERHSKSRRKARMMR